jgi:hypothetical protein
MLMMAVTDDVVRDGSLPTVGGFVQSVSFTKDGFAPIYGSLRSAGGRSWRSMTQQDLRSYSEIAKKRYDIPSVNHKGRVQP